MRLEPGEGDTGSPLWRVCRLGAAVIQLALGAAFVGGLLLWARQGSLPGALRGVPDTWTAEGLAAVLADSVPSGWALTYLMSLEALVAAAGLSAAALVWRGATTWFHLYVATALALFGTCSGSIALAIEPSVPDAVAAAALVLNGLAWVALWPLAYLFPDGRFVPRWTRWCALGWALFLPLAGVLALVAPEPRDSIEMVVVFILFGTAAYAVVHRYRKVSGVEERIQTRGVAAAVALWFALVLVFVLTPLRELREETTGEGLALHAVLLLVSYLIVAMLPAAIAVAVLRHRLYDVDVWVNRTLVYATLTGLVATTYALLATSAGRLWAGPNLTVSLLVTALLVIAFDPVRRRVQAAVDRYVFGRRKDPYAVLADLGARLGDTLRPDEVLETLAHTVGTSLKVPYVQASIAGGPAATYGEPSGGEPITFALRSDDDVLGELSLTPGPGDTLSAADHELLDVLSRQAGLALRAATLNDDLRRSRELIVLAREEERRRLQRDLHDGLGPTLASLYQRVEAARPMLTRSPETADRMLGEVAEHTHGVIADIRALVYGLSPPELDEVGLVGAIALVAERFDNLEIRVGDDPVPRLPPAMEVAAYRVVVEAITNAARHSRAQSVDVQVHVVGNTLIAEVVDDGCGLGPSVKPGTGLRSMRERAEEVGGTLEVSGGDGTRVRAVLPLSGSQR